MVGCVKEVRTVENETEVLTCSNCHVIVRQAVPAHWLAEEGAPIKHAILLLPGSCALRENGTCAFFEERTCAEAVIFFAFRKVFPEATVILVVVPDSLSTLINGLQIPTQEEE